MSGHHYHSRGAHHGANHLLAHLIADVLTFGLLALLRWWFPPPWWETSPTKARSTTGKPAVSRTPPMPAQGAAENPSDVRQAARKALAEAVAKRDESGAAVIPEGRHVPPVVREG